MQQITYNVFGITYENKLVGFYALYVIRYTLYGGLHV